MSGKLGEVKHAGDRAVTVVVYVNTSKDVNDPENVKVSPVRTLRKTGSMKTILKALPSRTRCSNEAAD
jgi:hypothetical protein